MLLWRFIPSRNWVRHSVPAVRMADTEPRQIAAADLARVGNIRDPDTGPRRAVWALLEVLDFSRHCFVLPRTLRGWSTTSS